MRIFLTLISTVLVAFSVFYIQGLFVLLLKIILSWCAEHLSILRNIYLCYGEALSNTLKSNFLAYSIQLVSHDDDFCMF